LLQRRATVVHFKLNRITRAKKSMRAVRQTMAVNLKPMTQSRLHHSASAFDLSQKSLDINMKIFVNLADMN
jgi:hypothetical protein